MSKFIELLGKDGEGRKVEVDDYDYPILSARKWYLKPKQGNKPQYPYTSLYYKDFTIPVSMHRFMMNPTQWQSVDHIDGNPLNYKRENLRLCNVKENNWNTGTKDTAKSSKYKGVSIHHGLHKNAKWRSRIHIEGKEINLGHYNTEEEAARAFDEAARKYHGEFARLNFP